MSGDLNLGIRKTQIGSKNIVFLLEFLVLYLNTALPLEGFTKIVQLFAKRLSQKFPLLEISTDKDPISIKISSMTPQ